MVCVTRLTQNERIVGRMFMKYFSLQAMLDRLFEDGWCNCLVPEAAYPAPGLDEDHEHFWSS